MGLLQVLGFFSCLVWSSSLGLWSSEAPSQEADGSVSGGRCFYFFCLNLPKAPCSATGLQPPTPSDAVLIQMTNRKLFFPGRHTGRVTQGQDAVLTQSQAGSLLACTCTQAVQVEVTEQRSLHTHTHTHTLTHAHTHA